MNNLSVSLCMLTAFMVIACSSSETTEPAVVPTFSSCTNAESQLPGGEISLTLPANFQTGSALLFTTPPRAAIRFFDPATGEIRIADSESRLPQIIEYALQDEQQNTIETHTHTIVKPDVRIMPLGDSITQGIDFFDGTEQPPVNERVGYRLSLYNTLIGNGSSFDFVGQAGQRAGQDASLPDPDNNGYPGVDITFISDRIDNVFNENQPDIVLLHIGTNQTPATAAGIDQIIDQAEAWSDENFPVQLLIATLVPKRDEEQQQIVDTFNNDLRTRIAQRDSQNVTLVEQALALSNSDISTEEIGIHPNESGYIKMADTWFDAMQTAGAIVSCTQ